MPVREFGVFTDRVDLKDARFVGDAVYVHRSVTTLGGDILVKGVPSDALYVVIVLRDFMYAFAWTLNK